MEKFPNFMKNTTVKIGPKHEKMPKYGIFMVEKFLTIVEYFLIFHKIFTPASWSELASLWPCISNDTLKVLYAETTTDGKIITHKGHYNPQTDLPTCTRDVLFYMKNHSCISIRQAFCVV